jgi:sensor histidine kinase YesM
MNISLKMRMYALLLVSAVIPLLLTWFFVNFFVFSAREQHLDLMIRNEIEKTGSGMKRHMDSLKYMSQQIVSDRELMEQFSLFTEGNPSALQHINERLAVFEGSNSDVANITFFYRSGGGWVKINNSLVRGGLPEAEMLFSEQGSLKYYGPHITRSVAGRYPAISLVRAFPYPNLNNIMVYIESGFKSLDIAPSESLRLMNTVFLVVDSGGKTVFSSDENFQVDFQEKMVGHPVKGYRLYRYEDSRGWSLRAYIPRSSFSRQTFELSFGFLVIAAAAALLSVFFSGFLWRSVRMPMVLFEENLRAVIMDNESAHIRSIHVREFDQNFEHLEKLKNRILELLEEVRQEEREKADLEMKILMFKINPHFIHNTLNTLKWYASGHGYTGIEKFLSSLNRLLLYNMGKNAETTLQSELDSIDDYIELQKLKYEISYSLHIDVPAPILRSRTPRFILYPLVENAILHGLRGKGALMITTGIGEDGKISVKVIDYSPALSEEELEHITKAAGDGGRSIGLMYVSHALESMFPGESLFRISRDEEKNSTIVEIQMPYRAEGGICPAVIC